MGPSSHKPPGLGRAKELQEDHWGFVFKGVGLGVRASKTIHSGLTKQLYVPVGCGGYRKLGCHGERSCLESQTVAFRTATFSHSPHLPVIIAILYIYVYRL